MTNAERFMQHYMEGMESPIRGSEEPDYVRAIKALMPDIKLEVATGRPAATWCSSSTR
jgi:hypothetical protein